MISWDDTLMSCIKIDGINITNFKSLKLEHVSTRQKLTMQDSSFEDLENSIKNEVNSILSSKGKNKFEFNIKILHRDSKDNSLIYMTWLGPVGSTPPWLEESYLNSPWATYYDKGE